MNPESPLVVRMAAPSDTPQILTFIRALAEYERLAGDVVATEDGLRRSLFGAQPFAECVIAEWDGRPAGFALFFHNFSTFLARPGIYLEDLFVIPELRGRGVGRALLRHLARLAVERECGRLEWAVLDWNEPAIRFYGSIGAVAQNQWTVYRVKGDALHDLAQNPTRDLRPLGSRTN